MVSPNTLLIKRALPQPGLKCDFKCAFMALQSGWDFENEHVLHTTEDTTAPLFLIYLTGSVLPASSHRLQ